MIEIALVRDDVMGRAEGRDQGLFYEKGMKLRDQTKMLDLRPGRHRVSKIRDQTKMRDLHLRRRRVKKVLSRKQLKRRIG